MKGIRLYRLKNLSLKWKLFHYIVAFCGVLMVLLWLFQVVFLNSFYKNIRMKEVKQAAEIVVNDIQDKNLGYTLLELSQKKDIFVMITDDMGKVIYGSNFAEKFAKQGEPYNNSKSSDIYERKMKKGLEVINFEQDIILDNGMKYVLHLSATLSPVNATITTLRVQLHYITALMILFSIILAFLISKRISKPIENINESAKILAKGEYDTSFNGYGYKEISELSDTLNYMAKELSKVEGLRQELIANISHDLRTPLTLISGYAEVMRDLPDENNAENAQVIIDEAKRLTTLVNDVLNLSKLQAGITELNTAHFNLTVSIDTVIKRVGELVRNKGYTIKFLYDSEIDITADETKISQAFYNILINAINYTGEDREVIVKQAIYDDKVKIEVIDSGDGIPEEELPYIWDRYYKANKNHKRAVTGSGLGLSIVKSIIEMHKGEYGVTSRVNEGSDFWFILNKSV